MVDEMKGSYSVAEVAFPIRSHTRISNVGHGWETLQDKNTIMDQKFAFPPQIPTSKL